MGSWPDLLYSMLCATILPIFPDLPLIIGAPRTHRELRLLMCTPPLPSSPPATSMTPSGTVKASQQGELPGQHQLGFSIY